MFKTLQCAVRKLHSLTHSRSNLLETLLLCTAGILPACRQDADGTIKKGGSRTAPTGNVTAALFAMALLPSPLAGEGGALRRVRGILVPLTKGVAEGRGVNSRNPRSLSFAAPLSGGRTHWVAQFLCTAGILPACRQDAGGTIKKGGSRTVPTGNVTAALFAMMVCAITLFASPAMSATITVAAVNADTLNTNASCSLREAITNINNSATTWADCANTGAAYGTSDTINIPAGTYTTTLAGVEDLNATGDFDILKNVSIVGAGAGSTFINGGALDRVFDIIGAFTVSISGVTIQNGNTVVDGGGIQNSLGTLTVTNSTITSNTATGNGGGIYSWGTTTVTNSTITSNTATGSGGGIYNAVARTLTVTNSTITSNTAGGGGGGGGISNDGTLTVANSTISGNTSGGFGGGIFNNSGTLTVTNSTIVRNTAPAGTGGGYFRNAGAIGFTNSIVADNVGLDCVGAITDNGGNIDSDGACGTFTQNAAMVQGTGFSALASNGGATQTHALLVGCAAIDAGNAGVCSAAPVSGVDQRGTARPQGSVCDSGAFEIEQYQVSVTVSGTGTVAAASNLAGFHIACPGTCSDYVVSGDSVTLVATPGAGLVVTWSGDCTGNGNCVLSNITADKAVTATFAATPITPTPTPTTTTTTTSPSLSGGSSSVSGSGGSFTVTVTNNGGSVHVYSIGGAGFSVTDDNCSGAVIAGHGTCQVTVTPSSPITSETTVTLLFYTNYQSAPVEIRVRLNPSSATGRIPLLSPANGAVTGSTVTFEWVAPGGGGYQFYLYQNPDFTGRMGVAVPGPSANRVLFAGAGLIFALGLITPGGRRRFYVLAFALLMFTSAGLSACGSGGGDSSSASVNTKYSATGLAKGAWFWKVTATGYQSETRTFTVQ